VCTLDFSTDPRMAPWRDKALQHGYRSSIALPLRDARGATFGALMIYSAETNSFSAEEIRLLEELADDLAFGIEILREREAHRKSREDLQNILQRLELATASARMGVWDWNVKDNIMVWDDRMFEFYGLEREAFPNTVDAWVNGLHPEDSDAAIEDCQAALNGHSPFDTQFRVMRPDGSVRHLKADAIVLRDENGYPLRMIGLHRDITAEKFLEEQLRQSQKMEAVGHLAGGVAHDFNNLLSVIIGYCDMLSYELKAFPEQKEYLDQIALAAQKAAQLTNGLLAFSRRQAMVFKLENLNPIVLHVHKFLSRVIGEDVKLQMNCCDAELPVRVDKGQIEQVLINLATNARDAMPNGGILAVKTEAVELDQTFFVAQGVPPSPGRYAMMSVSDTGIGIDREHIHHIFEPFFTTKEVGKGTGLGMAIIYGIVKQHNGFINVYSEVGVGTTFRLYLPISMMQEPSSGGKPALLPPERGSETILVAEDDPAVRSLVQRMLGKHGYEVILAEDGQDAIEKFAAAQDRISLILMDVIMPRKNGPEAYETISRMRPGVKVLYSSGYTADFIKNRGISEDDFELIMKPVQPVELLRKVRQMLEKT
jgi:PAS domain S-box-containing protein